MLPLCHTTTKTKNLPVSPPKFNVDSQYEDYAKGHSSGQAYSNIEIRGQAGGMLLMYEVRAMTLRLGVGMWGSAVGRGV